MVKTQGRTHIYLQARRLTTEILKPPELCSFCKDEWKMTGDQSEITIGR